MPSTALSNPPPTAEFQPQIPWNWKRLGRWLVGLLLGFSVIYVYAMNQPWGKPAPGVRLEPSKISPAAIRSGSMYDLLQKAAAELAAHPLPETMEEEQSMLMETAWTTADHPEFSAALDVQCSFFPTLEAALLQPSDGIDDGPEFAQKFGKLFGALQLWSMRDLDTPQRSEVLRWLPLRLLLISKWEAGQGVWGGVLASGLRSRSYEFAGILAAHLQSSEEFTKLTAILKQPFPEQSAADTLRYHLRHTLSMLERDPNYGNKNWRHYLHGSDFQITNGNLRYAWSLLIDQAEKHPDKDPSVALNQITENPRWMFYFLSDCPTRLVVLTDQRLVAAWWKHGLKSAEAYRRIALAVVALRRYHQTHDQWPNALTEAMPEVPLDPFAEDLKPISYQLSPSGRWKILTADGAFAESEPAPPELSEP